MEVVVVGGGDSACEEALFLTRFCKKITLIHRRDKLRASKIMAERAMAHEKINLLWNTGVDEVIAGEDGKARAVKVRNLNDGTSQEIPCKGVFIAIGHVPNTAPFQGILTLDENGYFVAQDKSMVKTNQDGVYVAGDCRSCIQASYNRCRNGLPSRN